jgi:hypothetical protein
MQFFFCMQNYTPYIMTDGGKAANTVGALVATILQGSRSWCMAIAAAGKWRVKE